jgi:hypothetical protein
MSSRVVFGAVALSGATPAESSAVLELLLEHGVNHIDTAASYGDSEDQLRPWLAEHRDAFFLATKTEARSRAAARDSIHRSLDRMAVASVELIQLHNLVHPGEWEQALGSGGALEAVLEARDEGLVRFVGVTGHGLTVAHQHRRALDVFPFDAVLAPCNPVALRDPVYGPDFEAITRGPWGSADPTAGTWYEPLTERDEIDVAVAFVLGRENVFLNTVGDRELLPSVLDAAERFSGPPDAEALDALVERARMTPLFVS